MIRRSLVFFASDSRESSRPKGSSVSPNSVVGADGEDEAHVEERFSSCKQAGVSRFTSTSVAAMREQAPSLSVGDCLAENAEFDQPPCKDTRKVVDHPQAGFSNADVAGVNSFPVGPDSMGPNPQMRPQRWYGQGPVAGPMMGGTGFHPFPGEPGGYDPPPD